jgi:hypothetical protein
MIKRSGWLEIHDAVVLFGLAGLFGKWLPIFPILLVLDRVAFASLALAAIIVLTGGSFVVARRSDLALLAAQGLILAAQGMLLMNPSRSRRRV